MRRAWLFLLPAGCAQAIAFEPVTYRAMEDGGAMEPDSGGAACPSGALACEDFSGPVAAPWTIDDNGGAAQVSVEDGALRVTVPSAGVGSGLIAFDGALGSKLFVRFRARLEQPLANASLLEVRHASRSLSGGVSLKVIDGKLAYNVTSRTLETRASGVATASLPVGRFTCLAVALEIDAAGHVKVEEDAAVVLDADADTLAGETSWDAVWIGLPFVDAPAGGAEVRIDDIVVGREPGSCD